MHPLRRRIERGIGVLLPGKLLYNVDSIGLPEQFSPDTNLDEIQTFLTTRNSFPEKSTW
jgi:hypothetical protein